MHGHGHAGRADSAVLSPSQNGPSPPAPSGSAGTVNPKVKAKSLIKGQLDILFGEGVLSRDQYREVAKIAVRHLYRQYGAEVTGEHAAQAVDEAMQAVFKGGG